MKQTATKVRPASNRQAHRRPDPAYQALIDIFPLRPLRSDREYDAAVTVLDGLAVRPEGSLDPGEQDYFDILTLLVEAYDREHHDVDTENRDPLTMLKYLMQESGMTQADLGRLLGNRALASLILNGHRHLSKSHIRKLADHFKVSPALFLQAEGTATVPPGHPRRSGEDQNGGHSRLFFKGREKARFGYRFRHGSSSRHLGPEGEAKLASTPQWCERLRPVEIPQYLVTSNYPARIRTWTKRTKISSPLAPTRYRPTLAARAKSALTAP